MILDLIRFILFHNVSLLYVIWSLNVCCPMVMSFCSLDMYCLSCVFFAYIQRRTVRPDFVTYVRLSAVSLPLSCCANNAGFRRSINTYLFCLGLGLVSVTRKRPSCEAVRFGRIISILIKTCEQFFCWKWTKIVYLDFWRFDFKVTLVMDSHKLKNILRKFRDLFGFPDIRSVV